jgi:arsenate reductase
MEHQVRDYLKVPLNEEELSSIVMKLNMKPFELIRTQEEYYRKELKGLNLNDEEWIKVMVENPKLIRRPIIEGKYKAVLGDPVENIDQL